MTRRSTPWRWVLAALLLLPVSSVGSAAEPAQRNPNENVGNLSRSRGPAVRATAHKAAGVESAAALRSIATAADLFSSEIALDATLPGVPPFDRAGEAFGAADNHLCLLMLEDFRLVSRHSTDGGAVFGPEVTVAGGSGQPDVKRYVADRAADGRVYAALIVADATGNLGLQFARSDDMCQNWTGPTTLVQSGDATHGVRSVDIATGSAGVVALVYRGDLGFDPYAIVSANAGDNWTTPVRVDADITARTAVSSSERIAVDPVNDNIYLTYSQDRGAGLSVWYTRSTDGGTSFAAEQSLDTSLTAHFDSFDPDIGVTADGSVLITLWDNAGNDHIYVVRSTNQGQTYGVVLDAVLADAEVPLSPRLATAAGSATALVLVVDQDNGLTAYRSGDNGATFGAGQSLTTSASGSDIGARSFSSVEVTRTGAGNWAVGWSDERSDAYAGLLTDVYVRTSADDGVSWGAETRVDSDAAGAASSWADGLTSFGTDGLFFVFQERRNDAGRSANMYANRATAASPANFGTDYRVDSDGAAVTVDVNFDPIVVTDGADHVYAAFSAFTTGPQSDVHVAVSQDGGYTFGTPVRVGSTAPGSRIDVLPQLGATPDGYVYLAYLGDAPGGGRQVRFNRSTDFGATWLATDKVLGTVTQPAGYFSFFDQPAVQVAALDGGTVYVAWSTGANILLARSFDGGATFATADIDQDNRGFNRAPRLCAQGDQVILAWQGADLAFSASTVWAIHSNNRGASWAARTQLRPEGLGEGVSLHALACDGAGGAVVLWPDLRSLTTLEMFANRFNGSTWLGDVQVTTPAGVDVALPVAACSGTNDVVVAYEGFDGAVYASRSTDAGATFPSFLRVDATVDNPETLSTQPRIVADSGTNVWIAWLDESDGLASYLVRHSPDGGASFGAPRRLDGQSPPGGSESFFFPVGAATPDTLPGAAFFTWIAERRSFLADALINVYDVNDQDRDQYPAPGDCDDTDPVVPGVPPPVSGLALSKITGGVRLGWNTRPGMQSDVATGLLSDLRGSGAYTLASCLADDLPSPTLDDLGADPPSGDARYYLVRGLTTCGVGSFGDSGLAVDPRDGLDTGTTCD